jgi:predicted ribosomally synthesized peptide with nif11-like leader
MSKETLEQFLEQVAQSEELQIQIGPKIDVNSFVTLGSQYGYEFSHEDVTALDKLSSNALDSVVGGVDNHSSNYGSGSLRLSSDGKVNISFTLKTGRMHLHGDGYSGT